MRLLKYPAVASFGTTILWFALLSLSLLAAVIAKLVGAAFWLIDESAGTNLLSSKIGVAARSAALSTLALFEPAVYLLIAFGCLALAFAVANSAVEAIRNSPRVRGTTDR